MIKMLRCEFLKTRRRRVFLTALLITAAGMCWALYGKYEGQTIEKGWMVLLYQLPLINTIFMPLLAVVVASRLADIEHKGLMFKQICAATPKSKLYDSKLIYGLGIVMTMIVLSWLTVIIFGKVIGFAGKMPAKLYMLYLAFTILPTVEIYIFQNSLSMLFKNQATAFFVGVIGEFVGVFSMFLPQIGWLRTIQPWGHYGALSLVGMYGWTKEERIYSFMTMPVEPLNLIVCAAGIVLFYLIGRWLFCRREI